MSTSEKVSFSWQVFETCGVTMQLWQWLDEGCCEAMLGVLRWTLCAGPCSVLPQVRGNPGPTQCDYDGLLGHGVWAGLRGHCSDHQWIWNQQGQCVSWSWLVDGRWVSANRFQTGMGMAQWLTRQTHDWKVAGLSPCSSRRIFFSRVDFLCWLLCWYLFHPHVTAVAHTRSQSFCQKCMWQVTAKHACTLCMWLCM